MLIPGVNGVSMCGDVTGVSKSGNTSFTSVKNLRRVTALREFASTHTSQATQMMLGSSSEVTTASRSLREPVNPYRTLKDSLLLLGISFFKIPLYIEGAVCFANIWTLGHFYDYAKNISAFDFFGWEGLTFCQECTPCPPRNACWDRLQLHQDTLKKRQ